MQGQASTVEEALKWIRYRPRDRLWKEMSFMSEVESERQKVCPIKG